MVKWVTHRPDVAVLAIYMFVISCLLGIVWHMQDKQALDEIISDSRHVDWYLSNIAEAFLSDKEEQLISFSENHGLAYLVIMDLSGKVIFQHQTDTSFSPPAREISGLSRLLTRPINISTANGKKYLEFMTAHTSPSGQGHLIRFAFVKPNTLSDKNTLVLMSLVFVAFILVLLSGYLFIVALIKPVTLLTERIHKVSNSDKWSFPDPKTDNKVNKLIKPINDFIRNTTTNIQKVENEKNNLLIESRVQSYKRHRIESVLQALPGAILVMDECGDIIYANDILLSLIGMSDDNIIGTKPNEIFEDKKIITFINSCYANAMKSFREDSMDISYLDEMDGYQEVTAKPLFARSDKKTLTGMLILFQEKSSMHNISKSPMELVATVVHEIKTPLSTLNLYSDVLQSDTNIDANEIIRLGNNIHDEVSRLDTLLNKLMEVARMEMNSIAPTFNRVRVGEFIKDIQEQILRSNKNVKLYVEVPPDVSPLYVDKELIRIAIVNLISNAIKYNQSDGEIGLSVEETDVELMIHVTDKGLGISDEDQKHIFEKFYRSDRREIRCLPGSGLGLSLVKEIVRLHNGQLLVESEQNKGSRFTIRFYKEYGTVKQAI